MKKIILLLTFSILLTWFGENATAVTIESGDMRLGINGYMNSIYTYMSKMPMAMGPLMPDSSTFEMETHLLFNAVKDRLRVNLNVHWDNGADVSDAGTTGKFGVMETFGEYAFSESLQVRAGYFLAPYGIYNQISYITPLFATVVLPMMYEPPENYMGEPLVPKNANVMLFGSYLVKRTKIRYYLYAGNGDVSAEGTDENKDKAIGGRIKASLPKNISVGASYYTRENHPDTEGRENLFAVDVDVTVRDINLQAEYAVDDAEKTEERFAYYARLTYHLDKFGPFIGYDYFKDKTDTDAVFKRGLHRYSIGTSYTANNYVTLKAEYHYHRIDDTNGLTTGWPEDVQMFKWAAIFIF